MTKVHFTAHLSKHLDCPSQETEGATVREVLDGVFEANPKLRGYVLDDQGRLRQHMMIFVGDQMIVDRIELSDPVHDNIELHVLQALSGG